MDFFPSTGARAVRATIQSCNRRLQHGWFSSVRVVSAGKDTTVKDTTVKAGQVGYDAAKSLQHILSWEDLPVWMQSDPYIRRGYRKQLDSFTACAQSIFYLHNESVNIWTHLLPTLFYVVVLLLTDYSTFHNGIKLSPPDNAALHAYIAGAIACLTFSVGLPPERTDEASWTDTVIDVVSHHGGTFGASGDTLSEIGLSGHLAERWHLRGHIRLCRPPRQTRPPDRLYHGDPRLRHRRILRRPESVCRRTTIGTEAVRGNFHRSV